jgi:hypothetical protein
LCIAAAAAVGLALGLELRLFAPGRAAGRREALLWSAGWLGVGMAVAAGIAIAGGPTGEWTTVYLIERSLSLDNVFLFSLLLTYFVVPHELRGRVILVGIAGALLLRGIAIAGGVALVDSIGAVVYGFGVLLLFVAYRTCVAPPRPPTRRRTRSSASFAASSRRRRTSGEVGCSSARRGVSTGRHCCSSSSRWWPPTSRSPSTRYPRPSR